MHQELAAIERAEIARLRIAQADHAQQFVADRIGDRDRVGKLLGGIDAVGMADRNIGGGGGAGRLASESRRGEGESKKGDKALITCSYFIAMPGMVGAG